MSGAVGRSSTPPPWPCIGWSHDTTPPEGYTWQWALAHDGWRSGGDGKLCRFTVGPGHTTCKRPAVATLLRGAGGRWGYCADHLYGRTLHDDAVWSPLLTATDDASGSRDYEACETCGHPKIESFDACPEGWHPLSDDARPAS